MKEEKSRNIALRLYNLISPLKGWVILSIFCMAGYNIFTAAPAYYAKDIVDAIVYGDNPEMKQYFLVGLGLVIVFVVKGLFFSVTTTVSVTLSRVSYLNSDSNFLTISLIFLSPSLTVQRQVI